MNAFDYTRHLCVGDLIVSDAGASVVIKWSKTIQDRVLSTTITIPFLGASALSPIKALRSMSATRLGVSRSTSVFGPDLFH